MSNFATLEDVGALWRELRTEEQKKAEELLGVVSDLLRLEAQKVGKDLDLVVIESEAMRNAVRSVTVDIVGRALATPTDETPMTQTTQSALGYSVSGTYLVPGGGLYIKKSELARLGLRRQRIGVIDLA